MIINDGSSVRSTETLRSGGGGAEEEGVGGTAATTATAAATRKSPYDPCPRDVPLSLVHGKKRSVVAALDVGPEGAPYPDRRVVAGDEVGWEDNGVFVPDALFPRRVRLGHPTKSCGGFEMGEAGAAYPDRMTVRLRWDYAEVGYTEEIEGRRPGRYRFVLRQCVDLRAPFGGLSPEEIKAPDCRKLSAAACTALADIYEAAHAAASRVLASLEEQPQSSEPPGRRAARSAAAADDAAAAAQS